MDALGNPGQGRDIDTSLKANHTFSRRPQPSGAYTDYYHKMTTYVAIIESQAQLVDESVTAHTRSPIRPNPEESAFEYLETSSARAGIGPINQKLTGEKVAIVGLGGTGSYILDLVAKTPVGEIHLFDGDYFFTHNAFRSPGAPTLEDLETAPKKVTWFTTIYSRMRRGIVPHEINLDTSNVGELGSMGFVFLCIDAGSTKRGVVDYLLGNRIPFIDVGIGLVSSGDSLSGTARVTRCTRTKADHVSRRIPLGDAEPDEYDQNIQVADMNALNAALAVIRWKKERGFYADFGYEHSMVYSVTTNTLVNDEVPDEDPDPTT